MALVGALSLMLLHDRFVASPRLAEPLVPDRVVVGDEVQRSQGACPGDRMNVRLLHDSLLEPRPSACPSGGSRRRRTQRLTYAELLDRSLRLARGLAGR